MIPAQPQVAFWYRLLDFNPAEIAEGCLSQLLDNRVVGIHPWYQAIEGQIEHFPASQLPGVPLRINKWKVRALCHRLDHMFYFCYIQGVSFSHHSSPFSSEV
jgi:hypothetical protein